MSDNKAIIDQSGKLKIHAFKKETRKDTDAVKDAGNNLLIFEAYASVDDFTISHGIQYKSNDTQGQQSQKAKPLKVLQPKLSFTLILDNTCVLTANFGKPQDKTAKKERVTDQVKKFLKTCYQYNSDAHTSNYLKIFWADEVYSCKLETSKVQYSLFDRNGIPLRATITASFIYDITSETAVKKANQKSPDVTHRHQFKAGDTLPIIAQNMYGSSSFYLKLAKYNGFNHFRNIPPGTEIKLPSIQELNQLT